MNNIDFLTTLTTTLLENGIDYEVTMKDFGEGAQTRVKLIDDMTSSTIAIATKDTLEEALASVLSSAATRVSSSDMLSKL